MIPMRDGVKLHSVIHPGDQRQLGILGISYQGFLPLMALVNLRSLGLTGRLRYDPVKIINLTTRSGRSLMPSTMSHLALIPVVVIAGLRASG
jgi:hypothetical protein